MKKHILLLTTGGTIACAPGGEGLEPQRSSIMERELDQLRSYYDITVKDVICLDSSNITPEEWQLIARAIFENRLDYDGIVVSHGTDTMAYTASAVTFLLPDMDRSVVFTGSQLPLTDMLSDGPANLRTAFAMAASGCPGVFLAFDRKVMLPGGEGKCLRLFRLRERQRAICGHGEQPGAGGGRERAAQAPRKCPAVPEAEPGGVPAEADPGAESGDLRYAGRHGL